MVAEKGNSYYVVGLLVTLSLFVGVIGCVRPPRMQDVPPPETTLGQIWELTWNYGTIDDYIRTWEPAAIGQGLLLYPADFVFDMGYRVPKNIIYDLPRAAWRSTFGDGEETAPALGRYTAVAAPVLLPASYVGEYFSGIWSHVSNNPVEFVMHSTFGYLTYRAATRRSSSSSSSSPSKRPKNGNNYVVDPPNGAFY